MFFHYFQLSPLEKGRGLFIRINLKSLVFRMICAVFSGSGEDGNKKNVQTDDGNRRSENPTIQIN